MQAVHNGSCKPSATNARPCQCIRREFPFLSPSKIGFNERFIVRVFLHSNLSKNPRWSKIERRFSNKWFSTEPGSRCCSKRIFYALSVYFLVGIKTIAVSMMTIQPCYSPLLYAAILLTSVSEKSNGKGWSFPRVPSCIRRPPNFRRCC